MLVYRCIIWERKRLWRYLISVRRPVEEDEKADEDHLDFFETAYHGVQPCDIRKPQQEFVRLLRHRGRSPETCWLWGAEPGRTLST
ncbi:MAG: hypothetical protein LUP99_03970 [Methanomicrobiales archaeon]|nr:hypothetical protein [Methanomicrobiales archaeon]